MTRTKETGFTISELLAAVVISMVLGAAMIGFMITWLQGFAAVSIRDAMTTNSRRALSIISDDLRATSNAVDYNQWPDTNAPLVAATTLDSSPADTDQRYYWRSYDHALILIRPARNASGSPIYDDATNFVGKKDNYVYFVDQNTRTLYRRVIPVPQTTYPTNILTLTNCTPQLTWGGCPATDLKLVENVGINGDSTPAFNISYYNNVGTPVTGATSVRSVVINLTLTANQNGTPITVTNSLKMEFRNN
jgi:type II secretory pathway pseudopilin PulG